MGYRPRATGQVAPPHPGVILVRPPADGACPGCGMDDEPLRAMPGSWCVKRWLCTWCAELADVLHARGRDLRAPWALPNPGKRVRC